MKKSYILVLFVIIVSALAVSNSHLLKESTAQSNAVMTENVIDTNPNSNITAIHTREVE